MGAVWISIRSRVLGIALGPMTNRLGNALRLRWIFLGDRSRGGLRPPEVTDLNVREIIQLDPNYWVSLPGFSRHPLVCT